MARSGAAEHQATARFEERGSLEEVWVGQVALAAQPALRLGARSFPALLLARERGEELPAALPWAGRRVGPESMVDLLRVLAAGGPALPGSR